jgi:hypothetical protein
MLVTKISQVDKTRYAIIQACPYSNSLSWASTSVEMTPNLGKHSFVLTLFLKWILPIGINAESEDFDNAQMSQCNIIHT